MGFFSQDCKGCGYSIRSSYSVRPVSKWMSRAVVLTQDGCLIRGEYDGYGRVNGHDAIGMSNNECWHEACWKLCGSPQKFKKASPSARDQGYFVGEFDPEEPQTKVEVQAYKVQARRRTEEDRAEMKRLSAEIEEQKKAGYTREQFDTICRLEQAIETVSAFHTAVLKLDNFMSGYGRRHDDLTESYPEGLHALEPLMDDISEWSRDLHEKLMKADPLRKQKPITP